jgi:sulfite exporter TauE/SafE
VISLFLLGLMGSLHCAGMCGPLVLMTPVVGNTRASIIASRLVYHSGRIASYSLIGLLFGLIGESIAFAGFQRWLSLIAGLLMFVAIALAVPLKRRLTTIPLFIKKTFGSFLRARSFPSIFALGATNGFLPCGLVYMAAVASIAAGGPARSVAYMLFFGLGTIPMLLGISMAGQRLNLASVPVLQKLAPLAVATVAILLIVRADPIALLRNGGGRVSCPACAKSSNKF